MRYQLGHDGNVLRCSLCGGEMRAAPVFDRGPICDRARCSEYKHVVTHPKHRCNDRFDGERCQRTYLHRGRHYIASRKSDCIIRWKGKH